MPELHLPMIRIFGSVGLDDIKKVARSKGGKLISESCLNKGDKLGFVCGDGHLWTATAKSITSGRWCPECSPKKKKTKKDMENLAENNGGKFLSLEYTGVLHLHDWKCKNGHIFQCKPHTVISGHWCKECGINRRSLARRKSIDDMYKLAYKSGGRFLSKEYTLGSSKYLWECENKHTWMATANCITSGRWCPICYKNSFNKSKMGDLFCD